MCVSVSEWHVGESTQTHTGSLRSGRETIMNLFLLPGVCSDACGSPDGSHVDAMVSIRQISAWPHTPKKPPPSGAGRTWRFGWTHRAWKALGKCRGTRPKISHKYIFVGFAAINYCHFRLRCIPVLKVEREIVDVLSTCVRTEQINLSNSFGLSVPGGSGTCWSTRCGSDVWKLTFLRCKTPSWQRHPILTHTTAPFQ